MEYQSGDTIQGRVSDLHSLKDRLRTMTPQAILAELDEKTVRAEKAGEKLNSNTLLAYYDVLDEANPVKIPKSAYKKSIARFAREHPEYLGNAAKVQSDSGGKLRGALNHFQLHRIAVAAVLAIVICLGTSAVALELPQMLIAWGQDVFQLTPAGGDMQLEQPTGEGFHSLDEALAHYNVHTYRPTWVPEQMMLSDIQVMQTDAWTSFIATYTLEADGSDAAIIKIIEYQNRADIPDIAYEDNGSDERSTQTIGDLTVYITSNVGMTRASWMSDHCISSIAGTFTDSEIQQIVKSIKMEG